MTENYKPKGIEFYSQSFGKQMILVGEGHYIGWIVYKHPDGQWVTLRRATQSDIDDIEYEKNHCPMCDGEIHTDTGVCLKCKEVVI